MNVRIEKKDTFYVSGYSLETSEEVLERDCAMLREKYEDELRSVSKDLYFIAYGDDSLKEGGMIYHLGAKTVSKASATTGATYIEVPATSFAIATVPKGASVLATWHEFFELFEKEVLEVDLNLEYKYHIEAFDEKGVCELWIPVKQ
jgi:predicted transcriptional regulator YdeE